MLDPRSGNKLLETLLRILIYLIHEHKIITDNAQINSLLRKQIANGRKNRAQQDALVQRHSTRQCHSFLLSKMKFISSALVVTLSAAIFQSAVIGQSAQSDCEIVVEIYKTAGGDKSLTDCRAVPFATYSPTNATKIIEM